MTTGHRSSVETVPAKVKTLLTPERTAHILKLAKAAKVDRTYDVRGVGNRTKDGKTVLIDRDLPREMHAGKNFDPASTLPWHEIPEWYLMHDCGVSYEPAHSAATEYFEKPRVKALGLDWTKYQEGFGPEIAANAKRPMDKFCPDIDRSPYEEDGDKSALRELDKARSSRRVHEIIRGG